MHLHKTPPCLLSQVDRCEYDNEYKQKWAIHSSEENGKSKLKKRNLTAWHLETLLSEVEARKNILFGTLSSGINSKRT